MASLTLDHMLASFRDAVTTFPDVRRGKNRHYAVADAALAAFSVLFTQCPSFLEFQRRMQAHKGKNNAGSLFGVRTIPSDNQIRNLLDPVSPASVFPVFQDCLSQLHAMGELAAMRVDSDLLVALDGTWYTASPSVHCQSCQTMTHQDVTTYYHSMITPVIVAPGKTTVIPLIPEDITPQDGKGKQDCEREAAKRWLKGNGRQYATLGITIVGDDLYSCQPICQAIVDAGMHCILTCKRESHPALYEWVDRLEAGRDKDALVTKRWTGTYHEATTYHWANHVPLKDGKDCLWVNWCEITVTKEETEKTLYHNAFVTEREEITRDNVGIIALSGRTRWKVENENNNTLKTKGYHLEHNYGHGEKHLEALLATVTLLAFLMHTMLDIGDTLYHRVRQILPSRQAFFNDIRALTTYGWYPSWDALIAYMYTKLTEPWEIAPG